MDAGAFAASANSFGSAGQPPGTLDYVATPVSRTYGSPNPPLTGTVIGFENGDTQISSTTGTLKFTTPATQTSNVGTYAIDGSGLTANNGKYMFEQAPGNATALTITPALLTVTPVETTIMEGQPVPTRFAALLGVRARSRADHRVRSDIHDYGPSNGCAGYYPIIPSGGKAPNYVLHYTDGVLVILSMPATSPGSTSTTPSSNQTACALCAVQSLSMTLNQDLNEVASFQKDFVTTTETDVQKAEQLFASILAYATIAPLAGGGNATGGTGSLQSFTFPIVDQLQGNFHLYNGPGNGIPV